MQTVYFGDLMNFKQVSLALLSCSLMACSGSIKQIESNFEYANKKEAQKISIPQGLKAPKHVSDFDIPSDINTQGPVGEAVDVRAPALVLPIAASSRVELNSSKAKIWFDQVFDDHELATFIHQAVEAQLKDDGVTLTKQNAKSYVTDWYREEFESGFWFITSIDSIESRKFNIQYDAKPHGRSVSVEVSQVAFEKEDDEGNKTSQVDLIDKQRAEMAMLNSIINQVDYQYRLKAKQERIERAEQQLVTIGENQQAEPAYLVDIKIDTLWDAMPFFFRDYGFTVSDLNETEYIYYVDFEKNSGILDFIWSDEDGVIDVADAKYQFTLTEMSKGQTAVTIYDASGQPLSNEVLTRIFPQMEKALSFKTLF